MKNPGELSALMGLVKACAEHGSTFPNINTMAMLELQEAERQAGEELPKRKEALRQRDAREQAERERGGRNERPGPSATQEPWQTQVRSPNEPILQRPNPATSIPNEGPTHVAPLPATEDAGGRGREVPGYQGTQHTRDIAMGEKRSDEMTKERDDKEQREDTRQERRENQQAGRPGNSEEDRRREERMRQGYPLPGQPNPRVPDDAASGQQRDTPQVDRKVEDHRV